MKIKVEREITQYIRGYVEPDRPSKPSSHREPRDSGIWNGWCLTFDTETTTDTRQALLYGFYQVNGLRRDERTRRSLAGTLTRADTDLLHQAGMFYNPDELTKGEIAIFRAYAGEHHLRFMTRDRFVNDVLYKWVYRYGALLIGLNLPFDLSRLAYRWTRGGKGYRSGFTFHLCNCHDQSGKPVSSCWKHPAIQIRMVGHHKAFIRFVKSPYGPSQAEGAEESSRYADITPRGRFVDVATSAAALFGAGTSVSLENLGKLLNIPAQHRKMPQPPFTRPITPEQLEYGQQDVDATWWAYTGVRDLYAQHNLATPLRSIYSEAGLGKAYYQAMNITPIVERQPDFPREILGYGMAALHGARVECAVRLQPVECEYDDFLNEYPTVNACMGLQELTLAKEITIQRGPLVTARINAFLHGLILDDLRKPDTWKKFRVLCLVRPHGDRLPVRTAYGPAGRNVALPLIRQGLPTWYALPDVIASWLLTGKWPEVLEAVELVPSSDRIETKPLAFFGDANHVIDPSSMDIFAEVVSLRREIKAERDAAKATGDMDTYGRLDARQLGLKLMANGTSYGCYVEMNDEDEYTDPQPVTVHALSSWQTTTKNVEIPGRYAFPPIGSLITSAGRLLLALAERLAADRDLGYAAMDTDSITLTKPETMDRETFYRLTAEIRDWFTELSPYRGKPPLLELEPENLMNGTRVPLYYLGVADKRYCLYNLVADPTGPIVREGRRYSVRVRKFSSHGLGVFRGIDGYISPEWIPAPCDSDVLKCGPRWVYDLWHEAATAIETGHYRDGRRLRYSKTGAPVYEVPGAKAGSYGNPHLAEPAHYQVTVSTWNLLKTYSSDYDGHIEDLRPFSFFSLLPGFTSYQKTMRCSQATVNGDDALFFAYQSVPTAQTFIGPYCRTASDVREAIASGNFRWYDSQGRRWVPLPAGIRTPAVVEGIEHYFQRAAWKSPTPGGVGYLPSPVIGHSAGDGRRKR